LIRIWIRQWSQEDRIDHAEDSGVGPDAERQRDDGYQAETGFLE